MSIENFSLGLSEVPTSLETLAKEERIGNWSPQFKTVEDLDKPFSLKQENREDLPPVSGKTRGKIESAGYPDSVIESIGSDAEANIYLDANLEAKQINGKDALIRTDINYKQVDIFLEKTNLERMAQGLAPLDANGRPIELHHIGQKPESPLAELTDIEHRGNGNDNILHNKLKESEIDRKDFNKERKDYWKTRAEHIINQTL